jgi:hypothetical protein
MWLALFGVVVGYGLVVGVSVVVSGRPGASAVDSGGPVTTGLSWLVWTLGTVSLVLDVELVVYVDDVADDGANSTGSGWPRRFVGGVDHRPHQQRQQHQPPPLRRPL